MTHHMTLFCATVQGQAGNSYYPNSQVITSAADLGGGGVGSRCCRVCGRAPGEQELHHLRLPCDGCG